MKKPLPRIDSPDNPKIKALTRLLDGKGDTFLVEGKHLVVEALAHGMALEIYASDESLVPDGHLPSYLLSERAYRKFTSLVHPEGIAARCRKVEAVEPSSSRLLVLDKINDPGNLGTILRTAIAFSYLDVILLNGTASPYSSKAVMASQGAVFGLNLMMGDPKTVYQKLREKGYVILASDLQGKAGPEGFKDSDKLALVLGSESHGISDITRKEADAFTRIAMGNIDSLNVAVAAGILMYLLKANE